MPEPSEITLQPQDDWLVIRQNDFCIVVKTKEQAKKIARALDDNFGTEVCINCGNYFQAANQEPDEHFDKCECYPEKARRCDYCNEHNCCS